MRRLIIKVLMLAVLAPAAQAEQNFSSANVVLPLCKTWLKTAIDNDVEAIRDVVKTEPIQLATAGMCAGFVVGIAETLRSLRLSCPPDRVTNEVLVRMVVSEFEKRPERLGENFIVPASEVMIASWPCRN